MNQSRDHKFNPAFSKAINSSIKILDDRASIAREPDYCDCDVADMSPSNSVNREVGSYFERLDLHCDRWIAFEQMDRYNEYFGYSGYDEFGDEGLHEED